MDDKNIISPLPGVFYRQPSPQESLYVEEGQKVKPGDVIGLIEVMKTYQEVKAEVDGVVIKFNVENEQEVDAGQILVEIE